MLLGNHVLIIWVEEPQRCFWVLCNSREVEKKNSAKISQLEGEAKEKEAEPLLPLFSLKSESRLLWQVKLDQLTMATSRLHQSMRLYPAFGLRPCTVGILSLRQELQPLQ